MVNGDLSKEIRTCVQAELDRDRDFVKHVIGVAVKMFAISLGLIAVALGFLGYKTLDDIKKSAESKAEFVVKQHIAEAKQNLYEKDIQRLKDDALVNYLIVKAASCAIAYGHFSFGDFCEEEYQELIQILERANSSIATFNGAYRLIVMLKRFQNSSRDGPVLHGLLKNALSKTYWIDNNDIRLVKVLRLLGQMNYLMAVKDVRRIALDDAEDCWIREAALYFLGRIRDKHVLPILKRMLQSKGGSPISEESIMLAIALIEPTAPEIIEWIENGINQVNVRRMRCMLKICVGVSSIVESEVAINAFRKFVDDGYVLRGEFGFAWEDKFGRLRIAHDTDRSMADVEHDIFFSYPGKGIIERLLKEAAMSGDIHRLVKVIGAFAGIEEAWPVEVGVVTIWYNDAATKIITEAEEGGIVNYERFTVTLHIKRDEDKVWVRWYDKLGGYREEAVKKIQNPKGIEFSYRLVRSPDIRTIIKEQY